jgi:hypothetical protein
MAQRFWRKASLRIHPVLSPNLARHHGPSVAAPGYDLYYLNVLGGPNTERTMSFCTDPAHAWLWEAWEDVPKDPRLPMTTSQPRRFTRLTGQSTIARPRNPDKACVPRRPWPWACSAMYS